MPTIHDVAKKAGVAPITVSRVISRSGYVTKGVRDRVEAAITDLGYVPNTLARSLRSRRSFTLALVLTDITNPFFTTIARGVEDAASDAGYMVIVCNTDESEAEEERYLRMLVQNRVDGILLVPARSARESLRFVQQQRIPIVVLDRRVDNTSADIIRCDSGHGAYELARLLVSLGHRSVALLAGPEGVSTSDDRTVGCWKALAEGGVAETSHIFHDELTQAGGQAMTRAALLARPRPTALFATNNFITIGALQALQEIGLEVPRDIALVGFDDLPPALVTFPFLTVASQPAYKMGQRAVELLLERLKPESPPEFREIVLPTELVIRQSSGGPVGPCPDPA